MNEIELAYVGLEIPEPSSLDAFFGEVIGLVPGDAPHTWRNDDKTHRVIVQQGSANDAAFLGFEASDDGAFDRIVARLHHAGFETTDGDPAERKVQRLVRTIAPWGVPVEIVVGLADSSTPFSSTLVPGGFLTEGVGFGHAVFATQDFDESHRFVTEGLGLGQSDWIETELAPGIELEVRFYHCNARHHTLALARRAVRAAAEVAPPDVRDEHRRRRRRRVRSTRGPPTSASRTGWVGTTTTACSASTCRARPASRSRSVTAPRPSVTTGTATTSTTASARGAIKPLRPA